MSAASTATQRKSLFRIPTLFEIFFGRLAKWIRQIAAWRKQGLLKRALQERLRRTMRLEAMEPRVLLSADPIYASAPLAEFVTDASSPVVYAHGAGDVPTSLP